MARSICVDSATMLLLAGSACGPRIGDAVRPNASSASAALGEPSRGEGGACRDVTEGGRPLVVDWRPEQRGDLEVAMTQGIAVMAYDCRRMELLPDCLAEGSYGFKGIVIKQQVIRLQDEDEIRANLPLSGGAIAVQIKGDLERGATLDLATALVGNRTGSRLTVLRSDLRGLCRGATHFVRGANVGAFVMQSGERAAIATAATLFSASAGAASNSSRIARIEDGRIEACKETSTDATTPPRDCGAIVRIHLLPISNEAVPPSSAVSLAVKSDTTCPEGLVLREGKCTKPAVAEAHECRADDAVDCRTQCDKGQAASCARLARLIKWGKIGVPDPAKVVQLFDRACWADHGDACSDLGIAYIQGQGVTADALQASRLFERACQLGEANGCFNLANLYFDGQGVPKDHARAFALYEQACNAGKPAGCINVGTMCDDGDGTAVDAVKAFRLFKKACEGDAAIGCTNLAYMYAHGNSVAEDQATALALYEKACSLADARGCEYAGSRYLTGQGVASDPQKAKALLTRACELGAKDACGDNATE